VYVGRASLGLSYYNQRAVDLILPVTVPPPPGDTLPTSQFQNLARVKNEGWEFEGRVTVGPVRFAGTYSITNSIVQALGPGVSRRRLSSRPIGSMGSPTRRRASP